MSATPPMYYVVHNLPQLIIQRHTQSLVHHVLQQYQATGEQAKLYAEFFHQDNIWQQPLRVLIKAEAGPEYRRCGRSCSKLGLSSHKALGASSCTWLRDGPTRTCCEAPAAPGHCYWLPLGAEPINSQLPQYHGWHHSHGATVPCNRRS